MTDRKLKILIVSPEVAPFAKTGGLADVAGSLPKALAALGHDVRVALPRYKQIAGVQYLTDLPVEMDGHVETAIIRQSALETKAGVQIPVYLVDNYRFFYRDSLYGYADEAERFNFFSKAVLAMLPRIRFQPDIVHCNDWQTGPIPLFLQIKYEDEPFYQLMATVFTIHNLQYQGRFPKTVLRMMGLGDEYFTPEKLEYYGQVNYMKAGIVYSDVLNTVSKKYAIEIQTPELGEGLDGLLRRRAQDLYGIINGIDYDEFDPAADPRIAARYDQQNPSLKKENKKALQREMGLPEEDVPLVGLISRLVSQKGLDLISDVIEELLQLGIQFVLLGSGEDYYQKLFAEVKLRHPQQVAVNLGFNAELAQRIYAGSDMFLMPSRFEPCGLGQLISLRYGTIPIVRSTGGLADTIIDYSGDKENGNGFAFKPYRPADLIDAVRRAVTVYRDAPEEWRQLVVRAMGSNFSWEQSAREYVQLYENACHKRQAMQKLDYGT